MQGIYEYTYIPNTNHVPKQCSVTAILSLLFMVPISLAPALAVTYFYISTFRSMCAVPNMAVFCSSVLLLLLLLLLQFRVWLRSPIVTLVLDYSHASLLLDLSIHQRERAKYTYIIYGKNASSHNHATCFYWLQFCYRRPGAPLCGIRPATDDVCATRPHSQGVESVHLRSPDTGVSLRLLQHCCVHVCVYFVFVKFFGLTQPQRFSLLQYSAVADHQDSISHTVIDTFIFCLHTKFLFPDVNNTY
jgi:hypothetical protein